MLRTTARPNGPNPAGSWAKHCGPQPRDLVYCLSNDGKGEAWAWGASVRANSLAHHGTTFATVGATWRGSRFSQNGHEAYAGPGNWNDTDMLVVGQVGGGWNGKPHPTHLTPDEQYTHLSLWSLLSSPLLIGCDLTRLDDFTLSLLTNDEVLGVDQDPLGHPALRVLRERDLEVWARTLADEDSRRPRFIQLRGEIPAHASPRPLVEPGLGRHLHGARPLAPEGSRSIRGSFLRDRCSPRGGAGEDRPSLTALPFRWTLPAFTPAAGFSSRA